MLRDLLLENFWNIHIWVLAVKVTTEFIEKFSISISPETVWEVLIAAGLNERSAHRKFLLALKTKSLGFHS